MGPIAAGSVEGALSRLSKGSASLAGCADSSSLLARLVVWRSWPGAAATHSRSSLPLVKELRSEVLALRSVTIQPSLLETKAIAPGTCKDCLSRLKLFLDFCGRNRLLLGASDQIEDTQLEFFDACFIKNKSAAAGSKLLAAPVIKGPSFHRRTLQLLPRACRALQGWGRLVPELTREAIPGRMSRVG